MAETGKTPPMDPALHLLQISGGYILASVLYAVTEAGVADHLAKGPQSCTDLAHATKTHEDALYRMLRLLASAGVFEETSPRVFGLTPAADLLRKNHPQSVRDLMVFLPDPFHFNVYANLMHCLRTGETAAEKTLGMPVFEYFGKNPEYSEIFNRAMTNLSAAVIPAAIEAYDFSGIDVIVDVAGGHGEVLMSILRAYPNMRGILVDLGHVIEGAKQRIARAELTDRVQTVAGDFFKSVPAGDAYIMKHIIHDWDDQRALQILRNVHTAMGDRRGKVILLEAVIQSGNVPDFGKVMDMEMLALPGGRERTAEEFGALFSRAGFELTSIKPTKSPICVIEAKRK